jgi:hypothetical protein
VATESPTISSLPPERTLPTWKNPEIVLRLLSLLKLFLEGKTCED